MKLFFISYTSISPEDAHTPYRRSIGSIQYAAHVPVVGWGALIRASIRTLFHCFPSFVFIPPKNAAFPFVLILPLV